MLWRIYKKQTLTVGHTCYLNSYNTFIHKPLVLSKRKWQDDSSYSDYQVRSLEWRVATQISEGGDSLVVSSLGPCPACVCSTTNRLSAGFQSSLGRCWRNRGTSKGLELSFPYLSTGQMSWFSDMLKSNPGLFKICNFDLSFSLVCCWCDLNTLWILCFKLYR